MQHVARCVRQLTTPGLCRISALVPITSSTKYKPSLFRLRLPSEESGMVFTLLRSGASIKITLNGNAPLRIPAVNAPATPCPPRPPGYSAPHIRVPPPTFRALNLPCSGFAFPAKSKAGYIGFLTPLRSPPNPTYAMALGESVLRPLRSLRTLSNHSTKN